MKLTLEIDIPGIEEYEQEARWGAPKEGEYFIDGNEYSIRYCKINFEFNNRIILKKKKQPDVLEESIKAFVRDPTLPKNAFDIFRELTNRIKKLEEKQ